MHISRPPHLPRWQSQMQEQEEELQLLRVGLQYILDIKL